MRKIVTRIIVGVLLICVAGIVWVVFHSEEPEQTETTYTADVTQRQPEHPETASTEHESQEAEQLRKDAEMRFEKLTRIEQAAATRVERGSGVKVTLPIPDQPRVN